MQFGHLIRNFQLFSRNHAHILLSSLQLNTDNWLKKGYIGYLYRLYRLCNAQHPDRVLKSRSEDRAFSLTEVRAHGPIICCYQLRENIGAILYRGKSQRTRTDFQSVATFMIVLIMKLMPQIG